MNISACTSTTASTAGPPPVAQCDASGQTRCNWAARRVDKKRKDQNISSLPLQLIKLFNLLWSWNEEELTKNSNIGLKRKQNLTGLKVNPNICGVRLRLEKYDFKSVWHFKQHVFLISCFKPSIFLQCQNRPSFLKQTLSGKCHLLLRTLQCRAFPCLPNDEDTWDYACRQNWLAAWFIDSLYHICAAYFKPLVGWIKMLENLSNLWVLKFHSEPLGTKALSNVITPVVCKYLYSA